MKYNVLTLILILILLSYPAIAPSNDCEKLAKDYRAEHGGDLILIQPLKDNGYYELGEYSGHWMNKAYSQEMGNYYYDVSTKTYYNSPTAIKHDFEQMWDRKVAVLNYNKGEVPFGIIWHY